jgi:hypothetical protein
LIRGAKDAEKALIRELLRRVVPVRIIKDAVEGGDEFLSPLNMEPSDATWPAIWMSRNCLKIACNF